MTREEQINNAAFDYADALEFPNPETRFGYEDIEFAFQSGAEWADKHHINVWHDASEIPQANHKNIMYQTNYYSMHNVHIAFIPTCLRSCKITSNGWNEFIKDVNMRRWAYVKELLPKGD